MKISVIGDQAAALPLMRQIYASDQHELGACWLHGTLANLAANAGIPIELESAPENAFLASDVTVAVLALNDCEQILSLARSASQSDRHVVVFVPPTASTAFSFELHLLLDESAGSIIPVTGRMNLPDLPFDSHVLNTDGASLPDSMLQLAIETNIRTDDPTSLRASTIRLLDIPGSLGLRYSQLTAIDAVAPDGALISRLITLGASATSEEKLPPATITFHAGNIPMDQSPGKALSSAYIQMVNGTRKEIAIHDDPNILPRIDWLCADRTRCAEWMESFSTAMELNDAVDKSLRRRRTVDVYFDSGSERGVFKSQMTAIGCAVLTWTLFGMVGFLAIAQVADLPPTALYIGRALWILPVALFLIAQFLLPLTRDRSSHK